MTEKVLPCGHYEHYLDRSGNCKACAWDAWYKHKTRIMPNGQAYSGTISDL